MEDVLTGLGIIIAILLFIALTPIWFPIMVLVGLIKLPGALGKAVNTS